MFYQPIEARVQWHQLKVQPRVAILIYSLQLSPITESVFRYKFLFKYTPRREPSFRWRVTVFFFSRNLCSSIVQSRKEWQSFWNRWTCEGVGGWVGQVGGGLDNTVPPLLRELPLDRGCNGRALILGSHRQPHIALCQQQTQKSYLLA